MFSAVYQDGVCALNCFSCVPLFATPWIVARQAPLSMGFSRQENWSGLLRPPPVYPILLHKTCRYILRQDSKHTKQLLTPPKLSDSYNRVNK